MTKGVAFAEGPSTFTRVLPLRSLPLSAFHRTFVTSIICTRPDLASVLTLSLFLCLPPHRTRVAEEGLFPSFSDKLPPTSQLQQSIGAGQKIFSLFAFLLRCRVLTHISYPEMQWNTWREMCGGQDPLRNWIGLCPCRGLSATDIRLKVKLIVRPGFMNGPKLRRITGKYQTTQSLLFSFNIIITPYVFLKRKICKFLLPKNCKSLPKKKGL